MLNERGWHPNIHACSKIRISDICSKHTHTHRVSVGSIKLCLCASEYHDIDWIMWVAWYLIRSNYLLTGRSSVANGRARAEIRRMSENKHKYIRIRGGDMRWQYPAGVWKRFDEGNDSGGMGHRSSWRVYLGIFSEDFIGEKWDCFTDILFGKDHREFAHLYLICNSNGIELLCLFSTRLNVLNEIYFSCITFSIFFYSYTVHWLLFPHLI